MSQQIFQLRNGDKLQLLSSPSLNLAAYEKWHSGILEKIHRIQVQRQSLHFDTRRAQVFDFNINNCYEAISEYQQLLRLQ